MVPPAAVAPGGESRGRQNAPLCPAQMANLEIPPQRWEMPTGQICRCQQKTKPLPSLAAGDKRERAQEQPCGGPSGTMATFSGAGEAKLDKGSRCRQTPAAASTQNRGCKFGFFHLNPLRRCERGEQASTLACHTLSLQFIVRLFDFVGTERFPRDGSEQGNRQRRGMESIDQRFCACLALFCPEKAELFVF